MLDQIWETLSQNQLLSAGLLISTFTTLLVTYVKKLQEVPGLIWGRIKRWFHFSVVVEESESFVNYIDLWMQDKYKDQIRKVELKMVAGKPTYTHNNDYIRIWRNRRLITIEKSKQRLENASDVDSLYARTYTISGLFARKEIIEIINDIQEKGKKIYNEIMFQKDGVWLVRVDRYDGRASLQKILVGKSLKNVAMPDKLRTEIVEDLDWFKSAGEHYESLEIGHKRGYLIHGEPGNGKSSMAYAIAKHLGYNILILDLSEEAQNAATVLRSVPEHTVVLIEDIDNFYNLREAAPDVKMNFSTFLNLLSGVAQANGVFTVMTTNNIYAIDPALLRAGRADKVIELKNPTVEETQDFVEKLLGSKVKIENFKEMSYANLQDLVITSKTTEEFLKKYNDYAKV